MKYLSFICVCLIVSLANSADSLQAVKTEIHGMGSLQAGNIIHGWDAGQQETPDHSISHVWQQRFYMQLTLDARIGQRARVIISGEGSMLNSWAKQQEAYEDEVTNYSFYPNHVEGKYAFLGDSANPYLEAGAGYFPYKYNPEVRNLGEYLFRTGTYPGYILNDFDLPLSRLLGLRLTSNLFNNKIHQDLLLVSETKVVPLQDWGLAYLINARPHPVIDIGAGVFFSHYISINEKYTTPPTSNNISEVKFRDTVHIDDTTYYLQYDTTYYSSKGIKFMARFTFDPKPFIPSKIFGINDLKLYAEAALVGLEDYKTYYDTLWQRIPVTVGFNIPTFKLLDVLSVEFEWYGSRWPNSFYYQFHVDNRPQPYIDPTSQGFVDYSKHDNWKWSVYARRELAGFFTVSAQVARDHVRLIRYKPLYDFNEETLRTPGDWWFTFKLGFSF